MRVPTVRARVRRAGAAVGKGAEFTGMCERFVRTCFGFSARYPTARAAWLATARRHTDVDAPAGAPVFWDILSGVNADRDHIALSVGGGYCISTSAGPGRTVAKVGIADLTSRWGMRYRGWSEDYHGALVIATTPVAAIESSAARWPERALPVTGSHTVASLRAWRILMDSIGITDDDLDLALQRWLRLRGYYTDDWLLNGDFRVQSITALQRFLHAKGLYLHEIDGERGPQTVRAEIRYLNRQRHLL